MQRRGVVRALVVGSLTVWASSALGQARWQFFDGQGSSAAVVQGARESISFYCKDGEKLSISVNGPWDDPRRLAGLPGGPNNPVDRFFLLIDDEDVSNFQLAYDFHDSDWKNVSPFPNPGGLLNAIAQARGRVEIRPSHRSARPIAFGASGSAAAVNRLRERCIDTAAGGEARVAGAPSAAPAPQPSAPVAAVSSGRYIFDALKDPAIRRAWQAMLAGRTPSTLKHLSGPATPSQSVDVDGQTQELFFQCMAHNCDSVDLKALFDGVGFVGLFRENGRITEVGPMTDAQRRVLRGGGAAAQAVPTKGPDAVVVAPAAPATGAPLASRPRDIPAVDDGSTTARAVAMVRSGQAVDGFALLTSAAVTGDVLAQANVGQMLMFGVGVPRDETRGLEWLEKAAAGGDAFAKLALGRAYFEGRGVTLDFTRSSEHFRQASATAAGPEADYWLLETPTAGLSGKWDPTASEAERLRLCGVAVAAGHRLAVVTCASFQPGANEASQLRSMESAVARKSWVAGTNIEKLYVDEFFMDRDDQLRNKIAFAYEYSRAWQSTDLKAHLQKMGFDLQRPR